MTVKMMMGCALAIGGFCIYSHAKMYAKPQAPQASAADLEAAAQQKVIAHAAQDLCFSFPVFCHIGQCMILHLDQCSCLSRHCIAALGCSPGARAARPPGQLL